MDLLVALRAQPVALLDGDVRAAPVRDRLALLSREIAKDPAFRSPELTVAPGPVSPWGSAS